MYEEKKSLTWLYVLIAILATAIVVGAGMYFWFKIKYLDAQLKGASSTQSATPSATTSAPSSASDTSTQEAPKAVVQKFLQYTLGTIPNSSYNEESARALMTTEYKTEFLDSSFIPKVYGIQQGPEDIKIVNEEFPPSGEASVAVSAKYGEGYEPMWIFWLVDENGAWKINKIERVEE